MVIFKLKITVSPEKHNETIKTLHSLIGLIRVQPGCISYNFYKDLRNKDAFILLEEWETQADLDRFIRSFHYRNILSVIDMAREPPEVKFHKVSKTLGLEAIVKVRRTCELEMNLPVEREF